jgi:ATPase subunit of ABC transporter with duplicated ATPase domains
MNLIKLTNVMKSFSGTMLFDKVSLDVNSGEKIALIGRNGTGKSTLIKLILGELLPDSGDLFINRSVSI